MSIFAGERPGVARLAVAYPVVFVLRYGAMLVSMASGLAAALLVDVWGGNTGRVSSLAVVVTAFVSFALYLPPVARLRSGHRWLNMWADRVEVWAGVWSPDDLVLVDDEDDDEGDTAAVGGAR